MMGFSPTDILEMLTKGLILPFLVIVLFWKNNKDQESYKKECIDREKRLIEESKEREDKLMSHLEKTTGSIEKVADSLEKLEFRMGLIEQKVK